jgi:hypothetical protein
MGSKVYYIRGQALGLLSDTSLARVRRVLGTTRIERFLVMATMLILPLENQVPIIAGFSISFFWFALLAAYVFLNRFQALSSVWLHPVFLAAYAFLGLAGFIETFHPDPSYSEIVRIGLMVTGALFISSVCRDKRALRATIGGYILAAVWMSVLLFLTTYGVLSAATAGSFGEASRIRAQVSGEIPLQTNLNGMASLAATGAVVALALALLAKSFRLRILFIGTAAFCLIATFLPISRSGVVILAVTSATVMFAFGVNVRTILIALVLGASVFMWVPEAVFPRLSFSLEAHEARATIYTAAIDHFSEYVLVGVGAGNFYGNWGMSSEFWLPGHAVVVPAHNAFAQVTIYWGVVGFLALLMVVWQAYRCIPKPCGMDSLSLCLMAIALASFLAFFAASDLYGKHLSVLLGMLVGAGHWIWPDGIVPSGTKAFPPHSKVITNTQP